MLSNKVIKCPKCDEIIEKILLLSEAVVTLVGSLSFKDKELKIEKEEYTGIESEPYYKCPKCKRMIEEVIIVEGNFEDKVSIDMLLGVERYSAFNLWCL